MVNAILRRRSDVGNPIVRPKQICRFPFRRCMVFLFVIVCVSQVIADGFNKIGDSPSWASQRGHETVDGVEYYYFTDSENGRAVLENGRQCAVNIMDDRTTLVLPELLGGLPLVALGTESCANLADVEEVKHGQWVFDTRTIVPRCSVCGEYAIAETVSPYCPWCGAKCEEENKQ